VRFANTDDFNRQFQELLTTYCWGAVWGDDALKPRDRSILNLGMIARLGRMHEFEAHFRARPQRAYPQELAAILRQVAVYCGFPAAVDCHRVAKQVLAAEAKKPEAPAKCCERDGRILVLNVPSYRGNQGPVWRCLATKGG
jgi:4-carboxymuconolactone decarboxylase